MTMLDWRKRCSLARPTYLLSALMALSACGTGEGGTDETMIDNSVDAVQGNNKATDLPILKTLPIDGAVPIRPDTAIQIYLDKNARTFARFRNQFEKGAFTITINQKPLIGSYDANSGIITGRHDLLDRYTRYDVKLLVKAMMNSPNTNSGNASYSFGFKTGSALHEATHLETTIASGPVSVDAKGEIAVNVQDDYGLAANNATVTVQSNSSSMVVTPAKLLLDSLSNGKGTISLTNTKPATVQFTVKSTDNTYGTQATKDGAIEFVAGAPASIVLTGVGSMTTGGSTVVTGSVTDRFGNSVGNGTIVHATCSGGEIDPPTVPTVDGEFAFAFTAPTTPSAVTITITSGGAEVPKTIEVRGSDSCQAVCANRQCGDNGCGSSCGTCGAAEICSVDGQCIQDNGAEPMTQEQFLAKLKEFHDELLEKRHELYPKEGVKTYAQVVKIIFGNDALNKAFATHILGEMVRTTMFVETTLMDADDMVVNNLMRWYLDNSFYYFAPNPELDPRDPSFDPLNMKLVSDLSIGYAQAKLATAIPAYNQLFKTAFSAESAADRKKFGYALLGYSTYDELLDIVVAIHDSVNKDLLTDINGCSDVKLFLESPKTRLRRSRRLLTTSTAVKSTGRFNATPGRKPGSIPNTA
jgi:hypothetical protein